MTNMPRDTASLILALVDDLRPVTPLKARTAVAITVAGVVAAIVAVALVGGIRADVRAGHIDPIFLLSAGLFMLLGCAASLTVITMSRPQIGSDHSGWKWAVAMVALLPVTAVVMVILGDPPWRTHSALGHGLTCLAQGSILTLLTATSLTMLLRKGAPTSPERAGLLTGIAAGSFGIFAFSFYCGINDIVHIGIWHCLVIVVGGVAARVVVPRMIRW